MSSDVAPKKGERTFAFAALLWSLGTLALGSLVLAGAGSAEPSANSLWPILITGALFVPAFLAGFRSRFTLGRPGDSTRLRRLSGGLSVACFVFGWSTLALAFIRGGDAAVHSTLRHGMPTAVGLSFGVLSAASLSLFLWESIAAVSEVRETKSKRSLVLATVLSMTMALICIAALSGVVVGRTFLFGES
ncbi:MAG: hypothetical protein AB8H86_15160 [Polyangiales bacterium]